ncbi:MAG: YggS family pyridoxal phosphate-dependent enzyme [Proteobacteria bacterium]|nr:YggS family pyridoxal phosphate-dependent enzyme [Pseudomonadota bacterium]
MKDITANFEEIGGRIAKAVTDAGRAPESVTLVAVSKVQPPEKLKAALDCGHRVFGENRVQEAREHWEAARAAYPDLKLHLIGGLQTNKARDAVALFDVIETIDRIKLADAVADAGRPIECFIQVNTGEEPQKGGVLPYDLEALYRHCTEKSGLKITGLMCIPPVDASPIFHFGLLATWAKRLSLPKLSMGMSQDFEEAIRMGATHVRVGSALFGERVKYE